DPVDLKTGRATTWWPWLLLALVVMLIAVRFLYLNKGKGYTVKESVRYFIPGTGTPDPSAAPAVYGQRTSSAGTGSSQTGAGLAASMKEINAMKMSEANGNNAVKASPAVIPGVRQPIKRPPQYSVNHAGQTRTGTPQSSSASTPVTQRAPVKRPPQYSSNPNVAQQAKIQNAAPKRPAAAATVAVSAAATKEMTKTPAAMKPPVKRPAQYSSNPNIAQQAKMQNAAPKRPATSADEASARAMETRAKAEAAKAKAEEAMKIAEQARAVAEAEAKRAAELGAHNAAPAASAVASVAATIEKKKEINAPDGKASVPHKTSAEPEKQIPIWERKPENKPSSAAVTYAQLKMRKEEPVKEIDTEARRNSSPFKRPGAQTLATPATPAGNTGSTPANTNATPGLKPPIKRPKSASIARNMPDPKPQDNAGDNGSVK
ncbi:MAG: hypothetical protein IKH76_01535, partial [Clostridiales bacterium]|nr:hypothetical protein [Clostridiales bacterium]